MRWSQTCLQMAILVAVALVPVRSVSAQGLTRKIAVDSYRKAYVLYRNKQYRQARILFRTAYRLTPRKRKLRETRLSLLFLIADCSYRIGWYKSARGGFGAYAARGRRAAWRKKARRRLKTIRRRLAQWAKRRGRRAKAAAKKAGRARVALVAASKGKGSKAAAPGGKPSAAPKAGGSSSNGRVPVGAKAAAPRKNPAGRKAAAAKAPPTATAVGTKPSSQGRSPKPPGSKAAGGAVADPSKPTGTAREKKTNAAPLPPAGTRVSIKPQATARATTLSLLPPPTRPLPWIVAGAGGAALATGVVFVFLAGSAEGERDRKKQEAQTSGSSAKTTDEIISLHNTARTRSLVGWISIGLGAALAGTSGVLAILGHSGARKTATAGSDRGIRVGSAGRSLVVHGRF